MVEACVWRCRNGHVMGQVRRNGRGQSALYLYRNAVGYDESPAAVDVLAVVQGTVMDIRCDLCGDVRTWVPGQAEYERLMRHYERENRESKGKSHPLPDKMSVENGN